jgi:hypothetical protein
MSSMRSAHADARVHYERLRLTSASRDVQEVGRQVIRYAFGLLRQAEGLPPRDDEAQRGPLMLLHESLLALYASVRREIGVPHADDLYVEPEEWMGPASLRSVRPPGREACEPPPSAT